MTALFFQVKMLRDRAPYAPGARSKSTHHERTRSPETLDVDVSLFTVPDRRSFADGLDYCPTIEVKSKLNGYMNKESNGVDTTVYGVREGRELKVFGCKKTHNSGSPTAPVRARGHPAPASAGERAAFSVAALARIRRVPHMK